MDVSIKTCRLSVGPARRWDTLLSSLILLSLRSGSEISKGCRFFFFIGTSSFFSFYEISFKRSLRSSRQSIQSSANLLSNAGKG